MLKRLSDRHLPIKIRRQHTRLLTAGEIALARKSYLAGLVVMGWQVLLDG